MGEEHLAIASVPIQQWGTVYEDKKALKQGTVFQDLDKPFFVTEEMPEKGVEPAEEQELLLQKINETSFAVNDLTLYLDMHCMDSQALELFQEKTELRKQLLEEFAEKFYPLTQESAKPKSGEYRWSIGAAPWEGVCA